MSPFELNVLIWPATAIFFGTFVVSFYSTRWVLVSFFSAVVKTAIYLSYYGSIFNGGFTFLDDWSYLDGGHQFLRMDIGLFNILDNWDQALRIGRGDHFLYYLHNAYAIKYFGDGYYSPVAVNIILSVIVATLGARLGRDEFYLNKYQSNLFYFFILFHPDILTWSNIMNGKDILVLLLHVMLLISISLLLRRQTLQGLVLGLPVIFILFFLRFYVPLIFIWALFISHTLLVKGINFKSLSIIIAAVLLIFFWLGLDIFNYVFDSLLENLVNPVYGFVRILLTPIPFGTDDEYKFLDIPMLIHWILIPFVFIGFRDIWLVRKPFQRFFCAYFIIFLIIYAVYGELQGPRHRIQLDYAFAIFQFLGLKSLLKVTQRNSKIIFGEGVI
jgi:hypothetical protein